MNKIDTRRSRCRRRLLVVTPGRDRGLGDDRRGRREARRGARRPAAGARPGRRARRARTNAATCIAALHREGEVLVEVHGDQGTRVRAASPSLVSAAFASSSCRTAKAAAAQPPDRRTAPGSLRLWPSPGSSRRRTRTTGCASSASLADAVPGGIVDCSVGTPVDPMPEVARRALGRRRAPPPPATPPSIGSARVPGGGRRHGSTAASASQRRPDAVSSPASAPRSSWRRCPACSRCATRRRDTVLYPAVAYPTYAMGAALAGLRAVPVPARRRAGTSTCPASARPTPTAPSCSGSTSPATRPVRRDGRQHLRAVVDWARERGVIVASDECYAEFTYDESGSPAAPVTVLERRPRRRARRALALEAVEHGRAARRLRRRRRRPRQLSRRGPQARRAHDVRRRCRRPRRRRSATTPTSTSSARATPRRRTQAQEALRAWGLVHDGGPSTFYLWLRAAERRGDGWAIARRLAEPGLLVAPGDLYGPDGVGARPPRAHADRRPPRARVSNACAAPRGARVSDLAEQITRLWDGRDDLAAVMSPSEAARRRARGDRPARSW